NNYGIHLYNSESTTMNGNSMLGNKYNFGVVGFSLDEYTQNIDTSNTVDGKPIYYWVGVNGGTIPSDAGYVGVVNSSNVTVENLEIVNNYEGVLFAYTTDSTISNVSASNNNFGIYLYNSGSNTLSNNTCNLNIYGIYLYNSGSNTIIDNTVSNNNVLGIRLHYSNSNIITGNIVSGNNSYGIYLSHYSNSNLIYHNNIIDNTTQAYDTNPGDNDWHHPDLLEGNYWSDYTGVDDGSGTGKHAIAGDGIGDTLIPHADPDYDNYPFINENGWLNQPPVADVGDPYTGIEGTIITFDASDSSDPDDDLLQYRWDFNNDGIWDTDWSTEPTATYTWGDDYSGIVVVEVSDGQLTDTDETTVTVNNVAPTVDAGEDQIVQTKTVEFTGTASDPGSDDLTFTWEFGDGETVTHQYLEDGTYPRYVTDTVTHTYTEDGIYTVTLTVEDDDGGVNVDTLTVTVDTTTPEAVIHWDPETRDIVVYGIDNIDEDVEITKEIIEKKGHKTTIRYTLTDDAGNYMELILEHKDKKNNRDVSVLSMSYNGGEPIIPPKNHYKVEFKEDKETGELTHVHQNIFVQGKFKINTHWDAKKDVTEIVIEEKGKPKKDTLEGLVIVDLVTNQGKLEYSIPSG
ncbi:MAG: right-handed parallel beta-helix repeat-containing protein, partial [Thermoplasmata archaeon]|nr:right-handed parallel beta-helix repeat-containing protein [Thermoplasmata archaeon]